MSKINNEIIYDPHSVITEIGKLMGDKGHTFDTATPLGMIAESIGYTTATAMQEMIMNNRNLYPSLATDPSALLRHITDEEEKDMFATPSEAYITLYVNINDIIHNGIKVSIDAGNTNNYSFIIAKNTTITVNKTVFTIMDDIELTLLVDKDGNKSLNVLYNANEDSYVYTGIGSLPSHIITQENIQWGVFQLPLKQLNVTLTSIGIVKDVPLELTISMVDQYVYSEVYAKEGDKYTKLHKIFSKDVLDITKPSVLISVEEDKVIYTIPKPYIYKDILKGELYVYTYTSKGKIELPLEPFKSEDFKFKLFVTNKGLEYTVTNNIAILATSNYIVDGGVNRRPFKDIRNKIIAKTSGIIDVAVTEKQLEERVRNKGFTSHKLLDTVTDRGYIAVRNTSKDAISPIDTDIDLYITKADLSGLQKDNETVVYADENLYIKENALFKLEGEVVKPFKLSSTDRLTNKTLLNNNEIFVSPLTYTIYASKEVVESKAYDLRNPDIKRITVLKRNTSLLVNCNIVSYRIIKTSDGYDLYLELAGNNALTALLDTIKLQLAFIGTGGNKFYYDAIPKKIESTDMLFSDSVGKTLFKAEIKTTFNVNNGLKLTGNKDVSNGLTTVDLEHDIEVTVFTTETTVTAHLSNSQTAIGFEKINLYNAEENAVVIVTERMRMKLGEEVKGIWNKAFALYNTNRYKKHGVDIPKIYTEDVFKTFNGCVYDIRDTTGDGVCDTIEQTKLHAIGDPVLFPGTTNPVFEHRKGDFVLDVSGNKVPNAYGIDIFADIFLLDYRYDYLNISTYTKHRNYVVDQMVKWCNIDLKEINDNMLERTEIYFRPNKNLEKVETQNGLVSSYIKPVVEIYYKDNVELDLDMKSLTNTIGKVISIYFAKKYIDINDLEKNLLITLPDNPLSVKVTYGAPDNIIRILSYNRFRIKKEINSFDELVYDIDIKIKRI